MLKTALQDDARIRMVTFARDAFEAFDLTRHYRPAILLVDMGLPPAGGLEFIRKVLNVLPETRILTISARDDDHTTLAALRVGAVGHIDKDVDPRELARLVTLAVGGEAIVPRRLVSPLLGLLQAVPDVGWRPLRSRLTTREWQIVELLADGASTETMAERLVLSHTTVYSHIKSVLRKLGVHSRREAIAAAEHLRREEACRRNHSW
jgi:DNA-binding NarL/FixJ family response regulator